MRTYIEGGGQILPYIPETGAGYRAKNREIKSRNRPITSVCDAGGITAIDDNMVRAITEYIVVNDDGIEIHLKCGAVITKEYVK